jgi:hypothetical protein
MKNTAGVMSRIFADFDYTFDLSVADETFSMTPSTFRGYPSA